MPRPTRQRQQSRPVVRLCPLLFNLEGGPTDPPRTRRPAKKAERDRMLAEEEASLPSKPKAAPKAGAAKKAPPRQPAVPSFDSGVSGEPSSFSASGIVSLHCAGRERRGTYSD